MSVKLICFDLDGTFLDDSKNIPPENLRAIEKAAEKGVHIVPATGRTYTGLPEVLRQIPCIRYFITANGAHVYDAREDKVISRAEIPLELAIRFYDYADTLPAIYDCYKFTCGYMTKSMWDQCEKYVSNPDMLRHVRNMRKPVPELKQYLREVGEDILKMQMFFIDMDERRRQLELMPKLFPELVFSSSIPGNVEINIAGGTKGQALIRLCRLLGFEPEEAMAIGDGSNDMDMIAAAGTGVAMENATPELKAIACYVTDNNNQAGFAKAIEKLVLS